jgi:hypothetical protein
MTLIGPCRFSSRFASRLVEKRAIDQLERRCREAAGKYPFLIKLDLMLDKLRGQPRFEAPEQIVSGKQ